MENPCVRVSVHAVIMLQHILSGASRLQCNNVKQAISRLQCNNVKRRPLVSYNVTAKLGCVSCMQHSPLSIEHWSLMFLIMECLYILTKDGATCCVGMYIPSTIQYT